jgi:hypothetical protein
MLGINLDTADFRYLENEVDRVNRYGIPNAIRTALTSAAFEARDDARRSLDGSTGANFTLRNTYTSRSILAERATGGKISDMRSSVGSIQEYMAEQEEGFTNVSSGRFGLAIPTRFAAGQDGGGIRTKTIRRKNFLQAVQPIKAYGFNFPVKRGGNDKSAVWIAMQMAIAEGSRLIFIDRRRDHFHRRTGFYRVIGGNKRNPEGAKLKLIYSTTRKTTRVKPHKWLGPSSDRTQKRIPELYRKSLIKWIEGRRR